MNKDTDNMSAPAGYMKTKRILFILSCIFVSNYIYAQIPLDTILVNSDYKYIFYNDVTYTFKEKDQKFILYKDTLLISIVDLFSIDYFDYNPVTKNLYFGNRAGSNLDIYCLNINENKFYLNNHKENSRIGCFSSGKVYYYTWDDEFEYKITIEDLDGSHVDNIFNIKDKLKANQSVLSIVKFDKSNKFLLNVGLEEAGAIYYSKYYIFNEPELSYKEVIPQGALKEILHEDGAFVSCYNLSNSYAFYNFGIIDSEYNLFSKTLSLMIYIDGFVLNNDSIVQLIVNSELDVKEKFIGYPSVLIQYNPSPFKEKVMYQIYNDIKLTKEELNRFDRFELRLIRNMIFAKHNYSFSDEFLTAYFNLYSFYRDERESRVKDVNNKLTKADKANLELIKSMEKYPPPLAPTCSHATSKTGRKKFN